MVEYGCNVTNKFEFISDNEAEDPYDLLAKAEVKKEEKTPAQKKAEKQAEKLRKEKEKAQKDAAAKKAADAAAAALKPSGKENARPDGRGRGRGGPRGAGGERRPPRESGEGGERPQFGEGRGRGAPRGRGGARGRGRGGNVSGGEEHPREITSDDSPKDNAEVHDRPAFTGRGRGRGGPRRDGDRPEYDRAPREFDSERSPRQFSDRPPRGRGGRGRFGDRQSGSDRTGVKAVDSKGGHGKANWGSDQDEIAAAENAETVDKPEEEKEPAPPREKTAEEIAREEEDAKFASYKTLSEFRAQQKKEGAKFNVRHAGEGADEKGSFGKLVPIQKKEIDDEKTETIEIVEIIKKEPRNKPIIVDFKFTETNRGGFRGERGGDRGRRGGGYPTARGRGGRGGAGGRGPEPFRVAEEAFPALGAA